MLGGAVALAGGVFWIDSIVQFDVAVSILYLAVLVLVASAGQSRDVGRACIACICLAICSWGIVHGASPTVSSLLRLLFACIAIGVTGALLVSRKRLQRIRLDLDKSRAQVERFANSVPYILWRGDAAGQVEYFNERWSEITGFDRHAVLDGQRYLETVHPDDLPGLVEKISAAVASQSVSSAFARIRHADGSYRWMHLYDQPARCLTTGEVERYGGASDVHEEVLIRQELMELRAELEESRAELLNFTDSVPQILWRADQNARVDFYNRRYSEIVGRAAEETIAKQNWIEDFHPDDREASLERISAAMTAGADLRATYRLRHADGSYRWVSLVGRPVMSNDGKVVRYYGGTTDIHEEILAQERVRDLNEHLEAKVEERTAELLRTEARYASLFDVSNMTFAEMDFSEAGRALDALKSEGIENLRSYFGERPEEMARVLGLIRTVRVNEALARLMGYESVAELVANPPAQNAEEGTEVLIRQLEMHYYDVDHIDGRTVLLGKDGRRIPVYYTVNRLPGGLHLSSHLNLTEQERIEGLRQGAQAELARANRVATVGAYSASIAHELNQPITSVLMDVQTGLRWLTRDEPDLEAIGKVLARIDKTAQRVANIVQRTRDNIVAGRRQVEAIDLRRMAAETSELLDHDLRRAKAELVIVCEDNLPLAKADAVDLQQVLVNLITNAADAMRGWQGQRRIRLEISAATERLLVSVSDTGPGIPDEYLEKLFDPFFTTKKNGIGMGLQICRSAIEAMGGDLRAANRGEGGAVFSFDLPFAVVEEEIAAS
jgi:PAS domain S-box-containing protein